MREGVRLNTVKKKMYIDARRERIQGRGPSPDQSYNEDSRDGLLVDSDGAGDVGVHEVNLPQHDVGLLSPAQLQGLPAHKKWIFNITGRFRLAYCSSHDVGAWKGLITATQPTTTMSSLSQGKPYLMAWPSTV